MAPASPLTRGDVVEVVGPIDDDKIADIIATGATLEELAEAYAWASDEADPLAEEGRSLTGTVAQVYDILISGEEWGEEQ